MGSELRLPRLHPSLYHQLHLQWAVVAPLPWVNRWDHQMGQSLFCLQCLKTWFWEFLGPNTCQKRKRKLNITLERFFQFEKVIFDHLTIPSIVNRRRVSQTTSTSDIPHTKKMAQNQTLIRRFWGWIGSKNPNCPKRQDLGAPSLSLTVCVVHPLDMSHQMSQKGDSNAILALQWRSSANQLA